jgi:hypothetical protein
MSTSTIPRPSISPPPAPAQPPPIPKSRPGGEPALDEPTLWQRTLMLFGTSFGVSLLLHLCVLSMLAFWVFRVPMQEILVIDAGVFDPKKIAEVETQDVRIAPPSVPKDDVSPLKSNAAIHAVSSGSPQVDFDVKVPDLPGMGTGRAGGDGNGIFGSGTAARSYVFVVDCSASMHGARFTLAISELVQTIERLQPSQRFFVVFYSDVTMPLFSKPSPFNSKDPGVDAGRFAAGRMNRFGNGLVVGGARRGKPARRNAQPLLAATPANRARAKRWIFQIRPGGGTLPGDALRMALAMKPQVVYFLTDGEIPFSTPDVVRRANKSRVIVHTVALGYEGSADLLKTIAKQNNGEYKFVK